MPRQWTLPGLRQSVRPSSTPSTAVVIGKKPDSEPIYRPMRPPQFFMDGSIAQPIREPELICADYRVQLQQPDGSTAWVRVTADTYRRAVIDQAFTS